MFPSGVVVTEWQLTWNGNTNNIVTSDIITQHLLKQSPGLEEAEACVAGVEVEAERGVEAPPAGPVSQGGGQLT